MALLAHFQRSGNALCVGFSPGLRYQDGSCLGSQIDVVETGETLG